MEILIADDDILVASALKTILEADPSLRVTGLCADGSEAVRMYRQKKPDVLLMDIQMKNMNGLEASVRILEEFPQAKILLLTTFSDDEYIVKALKSGVKGYLLKQDYQSILPYGVPKFRRFAINVWDVAPEGKTDEQIAREGLTAMEAWMKELGLVMNLSDLGATEDMLEGIADGTIILPGGYKVLEHEEIVEILKESLK